MASAFPRAKREVTPRRFTLGASVATALMMSFAASAPATAETDAVLRAVRDAQAIDTMRAMELDPNPTGTVIEHSGSDRTLYHLPSSARGWRLEGEIATLEWPVFVTEGQIEGGATLRLAYRSALSVMPERSTIEVSVNGHRVAAERIDAASGAVLELPLDARHLAPGHNAVSILARQRHRVDCSVDATYELWTAIDPAGSGLVFERGNGALRDPADIGAVARDASGAINVSLVTDGAPDEAEAAILLAALQEVTLAGDYRAPRVGWSERPGSGPGLDLFVGTPASLKRVAPDLAARMKGTTEPRLLARDGEERVALVVPIEGEDGLEALRRSLAPAREPQGTAAGLAALARAGGLVAREGEAIDFAGAGLTDLEHSSRRVARGFDVLLPPDMVAADYGNAELTLTLGHAGGLTREARARIVVNGEPVAHLPLVGARARLLRERVVDVPLSAFRPGRNRVAVEAVTPLAADEACTPATLLDETPRLLLAGEGSVRFPRLARRASLPSLAPLIDTGFPYVGQGNQRETTLILPPAAMTGPGGTRDAAATLVARLASAAGSPLDLSVSFDSDAAPRDAIVVAPWTVLPEGTRETVDGLTPEAVVLLDSSGLALDPVVTASIPERGSAAPLVALERGSNSIAGSNLIDRWSRRSADEDGGSWRGALAASVGKLSSRLAKDDGAARPIANPGAAVLSQSLRPDGGAWTVLTARDGVGLLEAARLLGEPEAVGAVRGTTVALHADGATTRTRIESYAGGSTSLPVADRSLGNLRLVLAGWFARNAWAFGGLSVFGLFGVGALTSAVLSRSGRTRRTEPSERDGMPEGANA